MGTLIEWEIPSSGSLIENRSWTISGVKGRLAYIGGRRFIIQQNNTLDLYVLQDASAVFEKNIADISAETNDFFQGVAWDWKGKYVLALTVDNSSGLFYSIRKYSLSGDLQYEHPVAIGGFGVPSLRLEGLAVDGMERRRPFKYMYAIDTNQNPDDIFKMAFFTNAAEVQQINSAPSGVNNLVDFSYDGKMLLGIEDSGNNPIHKIPLDGKENKSYDTNKSGSAGITWNGKYIYTMSN